MSLSAAQLTTLAEVLAAAPDANPLPALRQALPGLAVTRCDAEDMRGEQAFDRVAGFLLYLVDTASHCWRIVGEPAQASGVVIARAPAASPTGVPEVATGGG